MEVYKNIAAYEKLVLGLKVNVVTPDWRNDPLKWPSIFLCKDEWKKTVDSADIYVYVRYQYTTSSANITYRCQCKFNRKSS